MFVPNAKSDALIDFQTLYNISHARQFQKKNCGQNLLIANWFAFGSFSQVIEQIYCPFQTYFSNVRTF